MKKSFLILSAVLLAACTAPSDMSMDHGQMDEGDTSAFTIEERSNPGELGFEISENGRHFSDYGIAHTKRMHVIIVRDDLSEFQHVHPVQDADGVWRVPYEPTLGGTYWVYADFVKSDGTPVTLQFTRVVDKNPGIVGFHKEPGVKVSSALSTEAEEKTVGDLHVQMVATDSADGTQFNYLILDAAGKPVTLEPYLGEKAHSVFIGKNGDYIHAHPYKEYVGYSEKDPPVVFVPTPKESFYRMFTQFQVNGEVITVPFDWQRR